MHWTEISDNPDSIEVTKWRLNRLKASKAKNFPSLTDFVLDAFKRVPSHARVVDVGYANHSTKTGNIGAQTTHQILKSAMDVSMHLVGIDPVWFPNCDASCHHFKGYSREYLETSPEVFDLAFSSNVIEHVDSPKMFVLEMSQLIAKGGKLVISTPNPIWTGHLYDWLNTANFSVNVDHTQIIGASEMQEICDRLDLQLESWGYFGSQDQVRSYRPGPGFQRLFWLIWYRLARRMDLPSAHNQIWFVITK